MDGSRFTTVSGQAVAAELLSDTVQTDCTFEDIPGVIGSFEAPIDPLEVESVPFYLRNLAKWVRKANVRSDGSFNLEYNWLYRSSLVVYGDWSDALTDIPVQVPASRPQLRASAVASYPFLVKLEHADYIDNYGNSRQIRLVLITAIVGNLQTQANPNKDLYLKVSGLPVHNHELFATGSDLRSSEIFSKLEPSGVYISNDGEYSLLMRPSFIGTLSFTIVDSDGRDALDFKDQDELGTPHLELEFAMLFDN